MYNSALTHRKYAQLSEINQLTPGKYTTGHSPWNILLYTYLQKLYLFQTKSFNLLKLLHYSQYGLYFGYDLFHALHLRGGY